MNETPQPLSRRELLRTGAVAALSFLSGACDTRHEKAKEVIEGNRVTETSSAKPSEADIAETSAKLNEYFRQKDGRDFEVNKRLSDLLSLPSACRPQLESIVRPVLDRMVPTGKSEVQYFFFQTDGKGSYSLLCRYTIGDKVHLHDVHFPISTEVYQSLDAKVAR